MTSPTTRTSLGELRGEALRIDGVDVAVYRGVPYGAPVDGKNRFAAPRQAASWDGTRDATRFGPSAPQLVDGPFKDIIPGMQLSPCGDDCLSLNVWAPAAGATPKPVLVWVHGGAFVIGSSSNPTHDLGHLAADQDVVAVSVNYRLGALGFLHLADDAADELGAAPNRGLLDIVLALRWVRENIAAFGGDPANVTAFGQSAGAALVAHLLAMPVVHGLIDKAILQSPPVHTTLSPQQASRVTAAVLDHLGLAEASATELLDVPIDALIEAQTAASAALYPEYWLTPLAPVVDGAVLPATPYRAAVTGALAPVPLVVGFLSEEMRPFPDPLLVADDRAGVVTWADGYLHSLPWQPSLDADALVGHYERVLGVQASTALSAMGEAITSDAFVRVPATQLAVAHAERQPQTYVYEMTWQAPGLGAAHAVDLPFALGALDRCGWAAFVGADDDAYRLSDTMRASWGSFARTGTPSAQWPVFDGARRATLRLGRTVEVVEDPLGARSSIWPEPE